MKAINVSGLAVAVALAALLAGCGSSEPSAPSQDAGTDADAPKLEAPEAPEISTTTFSLDGLTMEVPDTWEIDAGEDSAYLYSDFEGLAYIVSSPYYGSLDNADEVYADFVSGMEEDGSMDVADEFDRIAIDNAKGYRADVTGEIGGEKTVGCLEIALTDSKLYAVMALATEAEYDAHEDEIMAMFDSIEIDVSEQGSSEAAAPDASSESSSGSATSSRAEALSTAQSYLDYTAFSHDGLVKQLEFEGYSHEDAVYAADNCGADWFEEAELSAEDYLEYTAFSYDGLIEQLEYEGFTHEQAVHAADNCGADWFEEAELSAEDYLEYTAFSYDGLIEQLEYEGFTHEQAVHAADNCGADWSYQAERMAQEYLESIDFSHDELVEQLEFEGFSHEDAEHGVSAAGL